MERKLIANSLNIVSAGYDADAKVLEVEYNGGGIYKHFDVEQEKWDGFEQSESKGRFMSLNVRNQYDYERPDGSVVKAVIPRRPTIVT